ncbi:MAG: hypothetical protein JW927_02115 [Deltaproteobacteria bacterium]|nr:hypothetical protein [Deltaproteobacteria bacterium]
MTKEQKRIVTILDKFAALVNGTTPPPSAAPLQRRGINPPCRAPLQGRAIAVNIPSEIALRKKQYEYYRVKLLTFNELNSPPLEGCQSKTDGVV